MADMKIDPMATALGDTNALEDDEEGQPGGDGEVAMPGRPLDAPSKPAWGAAVVQDKDGNVYLAQMHGVPCPAVDKMLALMGAAYAQAIADYSVYNLQVVAYQQQQEASKNANGAVDPQDQKRPDDG